MDKEFSKITNKVHSDIRGELYLKSLKMIEEGKNIIKLNTGNPATFGFKMPESIKKEITNSLDKATGYCDLRGITKSREAILKYHRDKGIKNINADDIFIGNGVSETAYLITTAIINKNDEILVPRPCYSLWTNYIILAGGKPVFYECDENSNWMPDIEDIRKKVNIKTKAIVIINPNNPTGALYSYEILNEIVKIAKEKNLIIISDEIYDRLILDGNTHISTASLTEDVLTITLNGLSKSHCICGLRCGWLLVSGRKYEKEKLEEILVKLSSVRLCSNALMQYIIPTALEDTKYTEEMIKKDGRLVKQRDVIFDKLNSIDEIKCVKNKSAFYLFPKIDFKNLSIKSDFEFAEKLLNEKNILVVPGSGFYYNKKDHFRIVTLPDTATLRKVGDDIEDIIKKSKIR